MVDVGAGCVGGPIGAGSGHEWRADATEVAVDVGVGNAGA